MSKKLVQKTIVRNWVSENDFDCTVFENKLN